LGEGLVRGEEVGAALILIWWDLDLNMIMVAVKNGCDLNMSKRRNIKPPA